MSDKKRIACFFTVGYTELHAMKLFLKKINDNAEYIQLCPIREKRSKKAIEDRRTDSIRSEQNGLTGEKLIRHILGFIEKRQFIDEKYDAVLIEDDKDDRFVCKQPDGSANIDEAGWETFKSDVTEKIKAKYPDLYFSAPLRKWKHGFWRIGTIALAEFT